MGLIALLISLALLGIFAFTTLSSHNTPSTPLNEQSTQLGNDSMFDSIDAAKNAKSAIEGADARVQQVVGE